MDDFEPPSFSLGLDAEQAPSSDVNATFKASNPFKIVADDESVYFSRKPEVDMKVSNVNDDPDYDSDFELLPPSNTPRIMKRLQRKSGHSVLVPSDSAKQFHRTSCINDSRDILVQNPSDAPKKKRASLPGKTSSAESKGRTLPNFWKGLKSKSKDSPASPCSRGMGPSGLGPASHSPVKPGKLLKGLTDSKLDNFQSTRFTLPDIVATKSRQPIPSVEEAKASSKGQGEAKVRSTCSVECFANDEMYHENSVGHDTPAHRKNSPETGGNSLPNHSSSLCNSASISRADETTESFTKTSPLSRNTTHENISSELPERRTGISEKISNDQTPRCSMNVPMGKTKVATPINSKTKALQSFWNSLADKKGISCENDGGAEEDDIESYSTDDDFEFGTRSTRKLSLCGNKSDRKGSPSSKIAPSDIPTQASSQRLPNNEALVDLQNRFDFQSLPESCLANERRTFKSTAQDPVCLSSASARPKLASFVVAQNLSAENSNNVGANDSISFREFSDRTFKNLAWQDSGSNTKINVNKTNTIDACNTSTNKFGFRMNSFGNIKRIDPSIAELVRLRFPHFLPVSVLRQAEFADGEQVFIDYENQFSGNKDGSCGVQSAVLQQQNKARKKFKRRNTSQKSQKNAMADENGWIQVGKQIPASRRKNQQSRRHRNSGISGSIAAESDARTAHWITETTGQKIYVTKDGRKLAGSSAYKQYIKDNPKQNKRTKRKRPWTKRRKRAM